MGSGIKLLVLVLWGVPLLLQTAEGLPRGIRNHNPGNILLAEHQSWEDWPGAVGVDPERHLLFRRDVDGLRAIVITLRAYHSKHKLRSPGTLVKRWTYGNDPEVQKSYAGTLCDYLPQPCSSSSRLSMTDPCTLRALTRGIVRFENGYDPYPESLYQKVFQCP